MLLAVVPVAVWLTIQALRARSFLVLPDELIYVEHAQSLAAQPFGGLGKVYGLTSGYTNGVYPALLAPLYALFDTGTAFTAAHILNAVLFASTAVPIALLLRHLGAAPWHGALAGLLAICVPWAVTTTVLMTEAAAYPAFAWTVFAMTVAVSDPRPRHDALALLAILVASGVRTQFVLLIVVLVAAILIHAATAERDAGALRAVFVARLRPHVPLAITFGVVLLIVLVVRPGVLGAYGEATDTARLPHGMLTIAAEYVARLSAGLTLIPMILAIAFFIQGLMRPAGPRHYAFALVGSLSALFIVYQAAVFSRNIAGPWLHERYAAYAVIPVAVGAVLLLADARRPAPLGTALAAGIAVAALGGSVSYEPGLPLPGWIVLAPAQGFNDVWAGRLDWLNGVVPGGPHPGGELLALAVLVLTLVVVLLLTLRRRHVVSVALIVAVLGFNVYATDWTIAGALHAVNREAGINSPPDRDWVDAVAGDRRVAVIPGPLGLTDPRDQWVSIQYWNTAVERLYAPPRGSLQLGIPQRPLDVDPTTGALREPIDAPLAVVAATDPNLGVAGSVVTRRSSGVALVELARPQRLTHLLLGADYDGETRTGADAELRLYRPRAGSAVAITFQAPQARRAIRWEIRSRGTVRRGRLQPTRQLTARLPVRSAPGAPYVAFSIRAPDARAAPDGRAIGLRIISVALE